MPSIAQCLLDEMQKNNRTKAWAGDPNLLLDAYEASGGKVVHPLNRIKAVLDAARWSDLFRHAGYIRACDQSGMREIRHPYFEIRKVEDGPI